MRKDMMTARFKRDYVTYFAVITFLLIIMLEVFVAVWIPLRIRKDRLYDNLVIRIQTIRSFDTNRNNLRKLIKASEDEKIIAEAQLLIEEMNQLAIYLNINDNNEKLSPEQVEIISKELDSIKKQYYRLLKGTAVTVSIELDTSKAIKNLAESGV